MATLFKFTIVSILLVSCREFYNNNENEIKRLIARDGDQQLDPSVVRLKEKTGYFIGYRQEEKDDYYLAYSLKSKTKTNICRVFTTKDWDLNDNVNHEIIKAANSLDTLNYLFDTIYDDGDSISVILVDAKTYSLYPPYSFKNISEISNLNSYVPALRHPRSR